MACTRQQREGGERYYLVLIVHLCQPGKAQKLQDVSVPAEDEHPDADGGQRRPMSPRREHYRTVRCAYVAYDLQRAIVGMQAINEFQQRARRWRGGGRAQHRELRSACDR